MKPEPLKGLPKRAFRRYKEVILTAFNARKLREDAPRAPTPEEPAKVSFKGDALAI